MFITKKSIIGIIKLTGIISTESRLGSRGGLNLNDLSDSITKAFSFKNIKAIVLLVNSPGGSPVQSALIANRIRDLAKEKEIPVYCFIEDLAASGGYWLSCAADKIYAMESSIIGSIGVITSGFGAVEAINKRLLDPLLPEKKEDVKQILTIQKDLHAQFISWVKKRRGKRLNAKDEILFNAGVWSGAKAKELGLIDGIGDYYNVMKNIFGDDIRFKDFSKKTSWFKQKFLSNSNTLNADCLIESLIKNIEERIIWSKYGL